MNLDNIDKERVNQSSVDLEQWKICFRRRFGSHTEAGPRWALNVGGGWMNFLHIQLRKTIGKTW